MKYIGITGGTGLVGRHLSKLLADDGYEIIVFTRKPDKNRKYIKNTTYAEWNPLKNKIDTAQLAKVEAMVHLAGEGIADKRWTEQRKTDIVDSRVIGTKFLAEQLKEHGKNCKVLVCSSAIGYYGADTGEDPFKETALPADDFLGRTCVQWEAASEPASDFVRRVVLRFGIVLGREGGAFREFNKPMNFGIMPILGSGDQVVSWIHVRDVARMIRFAIERTEVSGIFNATAPLPVTHSNLVHSMARAKGGIKIPMPVPAFLLKLVLGEMSIEVLKSCTVSSGKIKGKGFRFEFRDIESAVSNLCTKPAKK
ncbi:MAG: TIGR01777 family oxidoreductase [Chitinophagaceae bacterium]|nr:TIGR01777 family oxidoreductase [Chitinophagaceae bacterium]